MQINDLGLSDTLVTVPKTHPAAKNRFIYYPDRLTKAPSSLPSAMKAVLTPSSPFYGLLPYVLREPFLSPPTSEERAKKNNGYNDESVDSFVSRRLGPQLAGNVLSALVHGIYAGDTRQLSMRAVFPSLWNLEQEHGSIIKGMLASSRKKAPTPDDLQKEAVAKSIPEIAESMKDVSVYSLQGGVGALPKALIDHLQLQPNVEMRSGCSVSKLGYALEGREGFQVCGIALALIAQSDSCALSQLETSSDTFKAENVVSALASSTLAHLVPGLPHLSANPAVTVGVVNLAFPSDFSLPIQGFGYLIPRTVSRANNPHQVLGVVFDSDMLGGQTRLTVMMGGHYWNGKAIPSQDDLSRQALETLRLHGLVPNDVEPVASQVRIQKDCIPQYAVGHVQRMTELHQQLTERFNGKLGVVGSSYSGVGINDCVLGTWRQARRLIEAGQATGLEHYVATH